MRLRTFAVAAVLAAIALLAVLNWGVLSAPTPISLGLMQWEAPLGLVMLGLTALLCVFFLAYVLSLHGSVLLQVRRHAKELQTQRELADQAEASRFTELRGFLEQQQARMQEAASRSQSDMLARVTQLENALLTRLEQSDNATAAYLGEMDDRLRRSS